MNKIFEENVNDEIDLKALFITFLDYKLTIAACIMISALLSIIVALYIPNTYTSKILLAPTTSDDSLSSQISGGLSSLSGLAGIAGISVNDETSMSKEAIVRIKSYQFFTSQFLPNINLKDLIAVKRWNKKNNTLIYNNRMIDTNTNKWTEYALKGSSIPSLQEAFKEYQEILNISEDRKTSFITISINHKSPIIAKDWLDIVINDINEIMRKEDIKNAENSINFLNNSIKTTNIQSIRDVISSLLEVQIQKLMLASSNDSYVFKILDAPIVPEKKSGPQRAIICILGTILGGLISLLIIFVNKYYKYY